MSSRYKPSEGAAGPPDRLSAVPPTVLADALRPASGPIRLLRAVAGALVCVAAAAVGHLGAGGTLAPSAVVVVFAGSGLVSWLLAARRVTTGQLTGLLLLCQVLVHLATPSGEMTMSALMVAGHLAATLVSVLLLSRGERLVWRLAEHLGLRMAPLLSAWPTTPVVPGFTPHAEPVVLRGTLQVSTIWTRGPPVASL